jgi:hypothetical protein
LEEKREHYYSTWYQLGSSSPSPSRCRCRSHPWLADLRCCLLSSLSLPSSARCRPAAGAAAPLLHAAGAATPLLLCSWCAVCRRGWGPWCGRSRARRHRLQPLPPLPCARVRARGARACACLCAPTRVPLHRRPCAPARAPLHGCKPAAWQVARVPRARGCTPISLPQGP